jgi:hypothetical protein
MADTELPHRLPKATIVDQDNRWVRDLSEIPPDPEEGQPKLSYVAACECGAWTIEVWPRDDPQRSKIVPFKCRSWRHAGECRLWKGAQDFVRMKEAMEKYDYWSHVNLTFEQPVGKNMDYLFRKGKDLWAKLRKRLNRRLKPMKYIQTWEVHRSGVPHLHVALMSVKLFESAICDPWDNWEWLLQTDAVECGFGPVGWCERLDSKEAMAGYLGKLARELTEGGKEYQIPWNAPKNFRRLRASVRLLPPPVRNPDITGILHFAKLHGAVSTISSIQE